MNDIQNHARSKKCSYRHTFETTTQSQRTRESARSGTLPSQPPTKKRQRVSPPPLGLVPSSLTDAAHGQTTAKSTKDKRHDVLDNLKDYLYDFRFVCHIVFGFFWLIIILLFTILVIKALLESTALHSAIENLRMSIRSL